MADPIVEIKDSLSFGEPAGERARDIHFVPSARTAWIPVHLWLSTSVNDLAGVAGPSAPMERLNSIYEQYVQSAHRFFKGSLFRIADDATPSLPAHLHNPAVLYRHRN